MKNIIIADLANEKISTTEFQIIDIERKYDFRYTRPAIGERIKLVSPQSVL